MQKDSNVISGRIMKKNMRNQLNIVIVLALFAQTAFSVDQQVHYKSMAAGITATDPAGVVSNFLSGTQTQLDEPVVVNILALRVQFVPDSLKTTTGDGTFDLSNESEYIIDRPPHNKTYFEHQLLAMRNYFEFVSKGKLILDYAVYPPAEDAAYNLPQNMVYYSGEEDEEKQKQRWSELLRDAVQAAQADNPGFENFDAFIVFHAGVGNDFAFDFSETPFDIQSAFIDLQTLQETLGGGDPNYPGIDIGNGFYIQEGIILPEQQSQKGIDLGLLGTATLLMGSQLGMPSLFNTETGRAGVGMWGLMDQGSYNYFGLIPAQPCAWMKLYMGWEQAVTVNTLEEAMIGTSHTTSAPHLIKVPITSTEYFLLENRQEDWNGDMLTYGRDEFGKRAQFDSLGNIAIEEGLRVITRVDEYDYGLPGSGILIWHIDEKVIRDNLATNTINNNPKHRGVDLVECDGPQDLGQQYAMFTAGYGTESGDYWDPFWSGNLSHQYINGERPVSLTPTSIPNSNAHSRKVTHIEFTNFSSKDTVMSLDIGNAWFQSGFPQYTGQVFGQGALNTIILPDDQQAIIAVAENGDIFGWKKDGAKIIENDESITVQDVLGNITTYPLALMASVGNPVLLAPAVYDFDADDDQDIVIVDETGLLTVYSSQDDNDDGRADLLYRLDFGERVTTAPTRGQIVGTELGNYIFYNLAQDGSIQIVDKVNLSAEPLVMYQSRGRIFSTPSGKILAVGTAQDGGGAKLLWQTQAYGHGDIFYIVAAAVDADVENEPIIVLSNDGYLTLIDVSGTVINNETRISDSDFVSAPALGDIDSDGVVELFATTATGVSVYEIDTGVPTLNFPVTLNSMNENNTLPPAPVFFHSEKNTESWPHLISATGDGTIQCLDKAGDTIDGFPLTAGGPIQSSPLIMPADQTNQGVLLFTIALDGFLYGWNVDRPHNSNLEWSRFGNTSVNSFVGAEAQRPTEPATDVMPAKRVFCYPNPSEDGRTFIRYTLNNNVDRVNIRIYDIAGELVTQFNDGGTFPGDHEVTWDVSNIQSGAYIARVEAQANSGNVVEFIKIAVVK